MSSEANSLSIIAVFFRIEDWRNFQFLFEKVDDSNENFLKISNKVDG
jgi:hypothetical protein